MYSALDRLDSIGGMIPVVEGSPKIIDVEDSKAIEFSGFGDGLFFKDSFNSLFLIKLFILKLLSFFWKINMPKT